MSAHHLGELTRQVHIPSQRLQIGGIQIWRGEHATFFAGALGYIIVLKKLQHVLLIRRQTRQPLVNLNFLFQIEVLPDKPLLLLFLRLALLWVVHIAVIAVCLRLPLFLPLKLVYFPVHHFLPLLYQVVPLVFNLFSVNFKNVQPCKFPIKLLRLPRARGGRLQLPDAAHCCARLLLLPPVLLSFLLKLLLIDRVSGPTYPRQKCIGGPALGIVARICLNIRLIVRICQIIVGCRGGLRCLRNIIKFLLRKHNLNLLPLRLNISRRGIESKVRLLKITAGLLGRLERIGVVARIQIRECVRRRRRVRAIRPRVPRLLLQT